MTTQTADRFVYLNENYAITDMSGAGLFDPTTFGLRPGMTSTACYRGYICTYALNNNRLVLEDLLVNHRVEGSQVASRYVTGPNIQGLVPERPAANSWKRWFNCEYIGLALPISFEGALIIGTGNVVAPPIRPGMTPPWKFQTVHELVFVEGELIATRDLSACMATLRSRLPTGDQNDRLLTGVSEHLREAVAEITPMFERDYHFLSWGRQRTAHQETAN